MKEPNTCGDQFQVDFSTSYNDIKLQLLSSNHMQKEYINACEACTDTHANITFVKILH